MQQSIFLTIATLYISLISFGQPPVDVWQVQTPSNPMNCTNTTVTVMGWNDATNYTLQTITHSYGNDTIWIEIPYQSPQIVLGALTSWSHTISLGNVPCGNWTVAARGYLGGTWQSEHMAGFQSEPVVHLQYHNLNLWRIRFVLIHQLQLRIAASEII